MEVHHHSHTSGKKWTHYFWEFLMLFLAVLAGFFAENLREHHIEVKREKQYIQSLAADLKDDIRLLKEGMEFQSIKIRMMDSLIELCNYPEILKKDPDRFYYLARIGTRTRPFANNSRTYDQLKSSGNFRLITNLEVSNRIMSYYEEFPYLHQMEDIYYQELDDYKMYAVKIFDPLSLVAFESDDGTVNRVTDYPVVVNNDPALMKPMSVYAIYMKGSRRLILGIENEIQKKGEVLIHYLEQKYHLSERTPLEK